jgi:hypothetical protein
MLTVMRIASALLTACALAGFAACTFVHIRAFTSATADPWPIVAALFVAGVTITLAALLAAGWIGAGRGDGWWSRAMDAMPTWTYLAGAVALAYALVATFYVFWTLRAGGPGMVDPMLAVAGATFMFFYAILCLATLSLAIAARTPPAR